MQLLTPVKNEQSTDKKVWRRLSIGTKLQLNY